jgi:hypothetical protein
VRRQHERRTHALPLTALSVEIPARCLAKGLCHTPEQYKAWSQNMGHEFVLTAFTSYGELNGHRQAEIIRAMGKFR